jgi:hypothetical protein
LKISVLRKNIKKSVIFFEEMLAGFKKVATFASAIEKKMTQKGKMKLNRKKSSKKFGGYKKRSYLCTHVRLRKCGDFFSASPKGEEPKMVL